MSLKCSPAPCCGGLVSETATAWDEDAANVIIASGRHLRVHPIPTEDMASDALQSKHDARRPRTTLAGHDQDVIAVATVGPTRTLSASEDGTLRLWDVRDATCSRTLDVGETIRCVAVPKDAGQAWDGSVIVGCAKSVYVVSLGSGRQEKPRSVLWKMGMDHIACSDGGLVVVASNQKNVNVVWRGHSKSDSGMSSLVSIHTRTLALTRAITSVAVSSDGSMIAIGDYTGRIHVCKLTMPKDNSGSVSREKHDHSLVFSTPSQLHWHSSAVLSLCFVVGGSVLLSGGAEAVLVSWKMNQSEFGDRSFRPRLGGAIWGISASNDGLLYAVTCADNAVRILDSLNMSLRAVFRGLAVPPPRRSGGDSPQVGRCNILQSIRKISIVPDPGQNGGVLIAGVGGSVQYYDVYRGEHVGFFPVVSQNQVFSYGARGIQPHPPNVKHVCMSPDSENMATVDTLQQSADKHDVLRFWHRDEKSESLEMIGRLESPHGKGGFITAVGFHPVLPVLATSSCAGTVKLWRLVRTERKSRPLTWRCEVELSYRESTCTSLSFSADGSMIAVGAGSAVVLWHVLEIGGDNIESSNISDGTVHESSSCSLKADLLRAFVHPPSDEVIQSVSFLSGIVPTVAATTKNGIYVWNVLSQCVWWSLRLVTSKRPIAVDPSSQRFAVVINVPKGQAEELPAGVSDKKGARKKKGTQSRKGHDTDGSPLSSKPVDNPTLSMSGPAKFDKGIVIFSSDNPVPICVHRLPPGSRLLSASFIPLPGEAASNPRPSPLVYMDGDLEVHTITNKDTAENLPGFSDQGDTKLGKELAVHADLSKSRNRLDALLSENWRLEAQQRKAGKHSATTDMGTGSVGISACLASIFAGSTHTQAPVTVSAVRAVSELLRGSGLASGAAQQVSLSLPPKSRQKTEAGMASALEDKTLASKPCPRGALASRDGRQSRLSRLATHFADASVAQQAVDPHVES